MTPDITFYPRPTTLQICPVPTSVFRFPTPLTSPSSKHPTKYQELISLHHQLQMEIQLEVNILQEQMGELQRTTGGSVYSSSFCRSSNRIDADRRRAFHRHLRLAMADDNIKAHILDSPAESEIQASSLSALSSCQVQKIGYITWSYPDVPPSLQNYLSNPPLTPLGLVT